MPSEPLVTLGVSGGLLPCPAALVVLLAAVSFQNVGLGMVLVLAFITIAGAVIAVDAFRMLAWRLRYWTPMRLSVLHTALAALGALELIRTLHQSWVRLAIPEEPALLAFVVALPVASALASLIAIVLGARTGTRRRAIVSDLLTLTAPFAAALVLSVPMGQDSRGVVGLLFVGVLVARLLPSVLLLMRGRERSGVAVFVLSLVFYASVAVWAGAASAAQGDQPHYLLAADRLARGSLDLGPAYADDALFRALTGGLRFGPGDLETHVARTTAGDRLVQGYGLALLVTPGWALGGKTGALLVLALVAAFTALQTWRLCRETVEDVRAAATGWAMTAFLAPLPTLAGAVYPNIVGAAAIVWSYRLLFTAPRRRPLRAGLVAGLAFLLTPRDVVSVLLVAPFALGALGLAGAGPGRGRSAVARWAREIATRAPRIGRAAVRSPYLRALALTAAIVGLFDLIAYGVPLPYAGYGFGIDMAQRLDNLPTLSFHPEVGLPGILFDRVFGLAGSAPWVFLGLAGVGPALRTRRDGLAPALAAIGGSIVALSVYRLWQGGWSPPNRYLVDVLPLWAPFVGLALPHLRGLVWEAVTWVIVVLSGAAAFLLLAVPNLGFNLNDTARLTGALEDVLVVSPLSWLPSFQAPEPSALVGAWLLSLPLWAGCGALVWRGFARGPARTS